MEEFVPKPTGGISLKQQVMSIFYSIILWVFEECVRNRYFLETWALPITVLVAVVAYSVLAAVFYSMDA